ncbi:MAG: putative ABC exporter domain-containing protein [Clostridiaceae bacterium]|nr:putative ABC exporter domain-containing protein [Clostridiaceae bacterium]
MKPLFYILRKMLKNYVKDLKKKPGTLILYIFLVLMMVAVIVSSILMPQGNLFNGSIDTYGAIVSGILLAVIYLGIKQGIVSGSSFFRFADVNLVFTAPISSTKVLVYGFIKQLSSTLFFVFFLVFQIPNLRNFLPITKLGILIILLSTFLLIFTMSIIGLVTYSITSKSKKRRVLSEKLLNIIFAGFGILLLYNIYKFKDFSKGVMNVLNSEILYYIPFIGWFKRVLMAAVLGLSPTFYINLLLCLAFIGLMIFTMYKLNADYYEDVLDATERNEELIKLKKSGKGNINFNKKKFRKLKSGEMGNGANAIFYRQLLEYRKSGIPFVDKITLIMLIIGIGSKYIFPEASMSTVLYFSIYMLFFFSFQGKWGQELSKPYIYLIPYSSASKLFFATIADILKNTVDAIVLFTVTGIMFKCNPIIIASSILAYVSFGSIYIYGDVLSRKLFGGTHSKNLEVFIKMGITFLIILPGLIPSIIIMVISKDNMTMQYLSYAILIIYNVLASGIILLLSKGILETLEMN